MMFSVKKIIATHAEQLNLVNNSWNVGHTFTEPE